MAWSNLWETLGGDDVLSFDELLDRRSSRWEEVYGNERSERDAETDNALVTSVYSDASTAETDHWQPVSEPSDSFDELLTLLAADSLQQTLSVSLASESCLEEAPAESPAS